MGIFNHYMAKTKTGRELYPPRTGGVKWRMPAAGDSSIANESLLSQTEAADPWPTHGALWY